MNILNWIKKIKNRDLKLLPGINTYEITTSIGIKMCFGRKKDDRAVAEDIKAIIEEHKAFFAAVLDKDDVISIGKNHAPTNKSIVIEYRSGMTFVDPKTGIKYSNFRYDDIFEKVSEKYQHPQAKRIFRAYRDTVITNSFSSALHFDTEREKEFIDNIVNSKGNWESYREYFCDSKNYEGLRMLMSSINDREFEKQYINQNIIELLNIVLELYKDTSCNNFIDKNIDIILKAKQMFKNQSKECMQYYEIMATRAKFEQSIYTDEQKEKIIANAKKTLSTVELNPAIKRELEKLIGIENNKELNLSKFEIIELVQKVLGNIDRSGKMNNLFNKKLKEGKIVIYSDFDRKDAMNLYKKFNPDLPESSYKGYFSKDSCYNSELDTCFIHTKNDIYTIPTIIHEFIHQYYTNNGQVNEFSIEIPSIFYEKLCIDILINNGYSDYKEDLENEFNIRVYDDFCNNSLVEDKYMDLKEKRKNAR